MSLDTLEAGTYTNRHDSPLEPSVPQHPESPPTNALPESPPPVPEAPKEPAARESSLIDDLSKQFAKTIGDQATQEPQPAAEPTPQAPPEKTWRDAEPPPNVTKKVAEDWRSFRSKANAEIEERNSKIKALEAELVSFRDNA